MRYRVNWLPRSRATTIEVAEAVEASGFDGLGVCDSPHYAELYSAMSWALDATTNLHVGANVTNPVTRALSVHLAGARALAEHGAERVWLGFGTGDSAVRTGGGRPATIAHLDETMAAMRTDAPAGFGLQVAAGGPRGAAVAGRHADGIVAGVGTSIRARQALVDAALAARSADRSALEVWATLRVAVADDADRVPVLRRTMVARAISAARFNLAAGTAGRDIPDGIAGVLTERFARYDFAWHGRSSERGAGENPNATLFADRPDVEEFLVERLAIVGTAAEVRRRLDGLGRQGFDGAYLSILFEDPVPEVLRLGAALSGSQPAA